MHSPPWHSNLQCSKKFIKSFSSLDILFLKCSQMMEFKNHGLCGRKQKNIWHKILGHKSQKKRQQSDPGLHSQSHVAVKVLRLAIKKHGSWSVTSASAREFATDDQIDENYLTQKTKPRLQNQALKIAQDIALFQSRRQC